MLRGAIFDIDGTLLDSMPIWDELGARYLAARGICPEEGLGEILFPMTIEEGVRYLKRRYALPETEETIRSGLMEELALFYRRQVPLKDSAAALLHALADQGIPMMLATIGDPALEEAALRRLGVWDCFEDMLTCEELKTTKKEPRIYLEAASRLGTRPGETLVFEDVYVGVHTAAAAGFPVIAVEDAASSSERAAIRAEADLYIASFRDLPPVRELLRTDWR
ncbi:MAG: HAD family phosphatase [Eubacteriales bacterium]|jgi:HAD superfamily hydrolase (TIGR01509 family)|nr:HAD family phosphatase [Eubacteriales bacterium]